MLRQRQPIFVVLIGVVLLALSPGCSRKTLPSSPTVTARLSPEELDRLIVDGNRRLHAAGADFGVSLNAFLRTQEVESIAIRRSYNAMLETVNVVRSTIRDIEPPDSESAQVLYNVYDRYLGVQEQALRQDFRDIVTVVESTELAFDEKKNAILPILQSATDDDNSSLASLNAARVRFAEEHELPLH